jgi:eukaryotic-like serine/threonine-protein kinase
MPIVFGRYRLLKKIASGGMGQVLLARKGDPGYEKLVVLKRILPHLVEDEEFFSMFKEEARIAMRLDHPNIARINEFGAESGVHFIEMEYVAGEDLRRISKRSAAQELPMPPGVLLRIIADAAAGLDFAHKAVDGKGQPLHLVHRDISPQNILLGFDGSVKLIDFGVAKAAGRAQHTATGILKGKFPYMSPEQADGDGLDARSDVFALGIVLWELLTSKRLFKGENDLATQRLVRACQVPRPSSVGSLMPSDFDAIAMKALMKNKADRYRDAAQFREALESYAVAQSIAASNAQLSSFMKQLCAEAVAREADPRRLEEDSDLTDLEVGGLARSATASAAPAKHETTAAHEARSGKRIWLLGVPLILVAGLMVWRWQMAPMNEKLLPQLEAIAVKTDASTPVLIPAERAPPDASTKYVIHIETQPPNARVNVGQTFWGLTPVEREVDAHLLPLTAKISLSGFEFTTIELTADKVDYVVKLTGLRKPIKNADPAIKTTR